MAKYFEEEWAIYPEGEYHKKIIVGERLKAYKLAQFHANNLKKNHVVRKAGAASYRIFKPAD